MHRSGLVLVALLAVPLAAPAAGLGRLAVLSRTGEPLNTEIEIVSIQGKEGESLAARVALSRSTAPAHIAPARRSRRCAPWSSARRTAAPSSRSPRPRRLDKPLVNLLVELSSVGGRPVVRQYSFLLDTVDRNRRRSLLAAGRGGCRAFRWPSRRNLPRGTTCAAGASATCRRACQRSLPRAPAAAAPAAPAQPPVALAQPPSRWRSLAAPAKPARGGDPETGGAYAVQPGTRYSRSPRRPRRRCDVRADGRGDPSRERGRLHWRRHEPAQERTDADDPCRDAVAGVNAEEARQAVAVCAASPIRPAAGRPQGRRLGPEGDDGSGERALAESRDRASALEQTRDDLKRLIEAREREIAELERQVGKGAGKGAADPQADAVAALPAKIGFQPTAP
jgi:Tfp pilus assembly protein FimV